MSHPPLNLQNARILVTNDDGIHAPGIHALERIAKGLSQDVWVVAPESEQSATSHSLTLRRPLRVRHFGERRLAVDGTPTDCVLVAHHKLMGEKVPDLVLSGVNHGGNLGEDVTYSGTVAAAMEGTVLGMPSIAFSQIRPADQPAQWQTAEHFAPDIIRRLASVAWPKDVLFNVNFPALPPEQVTGMVVCRQGQRDLGTELVDGVDPGGRPYIWIGQFQSDDTSQQDSDLAAVAQGAISITPLHLDLTHSATLESLRKVFT